MISHSGHALGLGENRPNDLRWLDASESLVESLKAERQPLVIHAEAVQDRCVQVADVHTLGRDVVAVVVRVDEPGRPVYPEDTARRWQSRQRG